MPRLRLLVKRRPWALFCGLSCPEAFVFGVLWEGWYVLLQAPVCFAGGLTDGVAGLGVFLLPVVAMGSAFRGLSP